MSKGQKEVSDNKADRKAIDDGFKEAAERMVRLADQIEKGEIDRLEARQIISAIRGELIALKGRLETKRVYG